MYKDLGHLNSDEMNDLIKEYYAGKSTKKILAEYNLSIPASNLYKYFPPVEFDDYKCEYCNGPLVANRKSKSNNQYYQSDLFCPLCHHSLVHNCQCGNCRTKRLDIQKRKYEQIHDVYSEEITPIDFENISFINKVYLGALCKLQLSEDMKSIIPYHEKRTKIPLTPSDEWTYDIYRALDDENIITVSPESAIEAFKDSDNFPNTYYIGKVIYNVNVNSSEKTDRKQLFSSILNPSYYNSNLSEQAYDLWMKIAVEECCEYLVYQLNKAQFDFSPGEKTYKTFEIILETFSVSQVYGIIWRAVADASKLYLERTMSRQHAANSTVGACERYAERARLNGWKLSEYSRIKDLPQSELSSFFFNRVLDIGELGFTMPPTKS